MGRVARRPPGDGGSEVFRFQFRKTELCCFHEQGVCSKGESCPFAHGSEELRPAPNLTKTSLCKKWRKRCCSLNSEDCPFAHGAQELRITEPYLDRRLFCRAAVPPTSPAAVQPGVTTFEGEPLQALTAVPQWAPQPIPAGIWAVPVIVATFQASDAAASVLGTQQAAPVSESWSPNSQSAANKLPANNFQSSVRATVAKLIGQHSGPEILARLTEAARDQYED